MKLPLLLALVLVPLLAPAQSALDKKPASAGKSPSDFNRAFVQPRRQAQAQAQADTREAEAAARQVAAGNEKGRQFDLAAKLEAQGGKTIFGRVLSVVTPGTAFLVNADGRSSTAGPRWFHSEGSSVFPPDLCPPPLTSSIILLQDASELHLQADGDPVNVVAYPTGETYQYQSAYRGNATVRIYALRPRAK